MSERYSNHFRVVDQKMLEAVKAGDIASIQGRINAGSDLNYSVPYDGHLTPLMLAATNGKAEVVEFLLRHGATPNITTQGGHSALEYAAEAGYSRCCKLLLDFGADPNLDSGLNTPLVIAVKAKDRALTEILLEAGANVNAIGASNFTPAIWAARKNDKKMIRLLHSRGADFSIKDTFRHDALWHSIVDDNIEMAHLIIQLAIDTIDKNDALLAATNVGNTELMTKLLDSGGCVEAKNDDGRSLIYYAIEFSENNKTLDVLTLALERGANPNSLAVSGWSPLISAAANGATHACFELLRFGADVNIVVPDGRTIFSFTTEEKANALIAYARARDFRKGLEGILDNSLAEGHIPEGKNSVKPRTPKF